MSAAGREVLREAGHAAMSAGVALLALLPSLLLLLRERAWVLPVVLTAVLVAVAVSAVRWVLRIPLGRSSVVHVAAGTVARVAGLAVAACCTLGVALPPTGRSGPFPSPATPAALRDAWVHLLPAVQNDVAPIPAGAEVVAASVAATGALVVAVDLACFGSVRLRGGARRRFPALILPVVLGIAPWCSFLLETGLGAGPVVAALAAAGLVLAVPVIPPAPARRSASRSSTLGGRAAGDSTASDRADQNSASRNSAAHVTTARDESTRTGGRPASARRTLHTVRTRVTGSAAVTSAAVVVIALAAAVVAPAALVPDPSSGRFPVGQRWVGSGAGSGVDPVLDLTRDLHNPADRHVITYTAPVGSSVYLRTNVIDDLFSPTWKPGETDLRDYTQGRQLGRLGRDTASLPTDEDMLGTGFTRLLVAVGAPTTSSKRDGAVGIDAQNYSSRWLPLPENAAAVYGVDEKYQQPQLNGTLRSASGLPVQGGSYSVQTTAATTLDELEAAPSLQLEESWMTGNGPDTKDRERIPAGIRRAADAMLADTDLAQDDAGGLPPLQVAAALRNGLKYGQFTYSEQAPVGAGTKDAVSVVEQFLTDRTGYCVHFAAAMALMARAEGIPSRVAVGYAPGSATEKGRIAGVDGMQFEVGSRNAHAWTELYFVGVGWVAFDPTPGRGATDTDTLTQPSAGAAGAPDEAELQRQERLRVAQGGAPAEASSPTAATTEASSTAPSSSAAAAPASGGPSGWGTLGVIALLLLGAAVLAGAAWLLVPRVVRSRRDARIARGGPDAARLAWREAARAAGVTGAAVWDRPAPEAAATWFPDRADAEAAAAAQRLAAAVDAERFAATAVRADTDRGEQLLRDVRIVRRAAREARRDRNDAGTRNGRATHAR